MFRAIFGYEPGSNFLELVVKGDGSLEDMACEFDISQIQYAFCRYTFKDSVIPKFFIIHWVSNYDLLIELSLCRIKCIDLKALTDETIFVVSVIRDTFLECTRN